MDPNLKPFNNERDIELPHFFSFLGETLPNTLMDVGAAHTHAIYAEQLRKIVPNYMGVDPQRDPIVENIVDRYIVEKIHDVDERADFVSCISVIEHIEDTKERLLAVNKLLLLSDKYVYLTFPYGNSPDFSEYNYRAVNTTELGQIFTMMKINKFTMKFDMTFNHCPPEWRETTDQNLFTNDDVVRCVRILKMVKD